MEKYYMAAKVLGNFEASNRLKFEDYNTLEIDDDADINEVLASTATQGGQKKKKTKKMTK